jgi:hypothetical protein
MPSSRSKPVDNTKSNKAFAFDPKLLYVDQSNPDQKGWEVRSLYRRFASVDSRIPQSLGISLAPESTFPAGGKLDVNSFVVIPLGVNNPSGGPEANKLAFELVLDSLDTGKTDRDETHVANAADTNWTVTENCKELSFKAACVPDLPAALCCAGRVENHERYWTNLNCVAGASSHFSSNDCGS